MKSNLYWMFRRKYLLRRLSPIVLIGLVCFAGWMYMILNALAASASPLVINIVH